MMQTGFNLLLDPATRRRLAPTCQGAASPPAAAGGATPPISAQATHALWGAGAVVLTLVISRPLALQVHYWGPITTLLVLKRDTGAIFRRVLERIGGTLAGGATATLVGFADVPSLVVPLATLSGWLAYGVQGASYGVFTAALTAWIVIMMTVERAPELTYAEPRILATAIGASLGIGLETIYRLARSRARTCCGAVKGVGDGLGSATGFPPGAGDPMRSSTRAKAVTPPPDKRPHVSRRQGTNSSSTANRRLVSPCS